MEDDKDDTDPVATACAIVIPTVFVAVVLTIMWRNGTLARAFEKAMQGASEALKAGEEAVNNNNNNTSNTNNNAPQPDVDELQREIEAREKVRANVREQTNGRESHRGRTAGVGILVAEYDDTNCKRLPDRIFRGRSDRGSARALVLQRGFFVRRELVSPRQRCEEERG